MKTTIGIIGLGQIGASFGLALKAHEATERVIGHDKDRATGKTAESIGAVDEAKGLRDVVKDAQVIFLCLPLGEIRRTLTAIAPDIRENAVVLDTAPVKGQVVEWVREILPSGRHYVGLVPAPNPEMLANPEFGIKAASPDLFRRTVMMVVTAPGTPASVEQLGMNVARMVGAKPMLTDHAEADGIMTTAHILPQLAAAALVEAAIGPSGWAEAKKLAGRPFTRVTGGIVHYDDPASLEAASLVNPGRVAHGLDVLIAALQGLRDEISGAEEGRSVAERLARTCAAREEWLEERGAAEWLLEGSEPVRLPGLGQQITQMFFGGRLADAANNLADKLEGKK